VQAWSGTGYITPKGLAEKVAAADRVISI
jgi:hypothetical protein